MRRFVWRGVLLATLAATQPGPALAAAAPIAAPPVTAGVVVKPVVATTMQRQIRGVGSVVSDPNAVLTVNAPFAAIVGQLYVRAGETVAKGQRLVALNATAAQAATFAQARAAVSYARSELARQQRLLHQQLATHAQVDQARNALTDAQARLHALQSVGAGQSRTVLSAATAGTVGTVSAAAGQLLTEGAGILTLAPNDAMVVRLGVQPERADAVQPGMVVQLRNALEPGQTSRGVVESVSAVISAKTQLRDVLVRIKPPAGVIDPPPAAGTFMTGRIILRAEHVVAVPRQALLLGRHGHYVFLVRGGLAHRVAVRTGPHSGHLVGVTGAVHAGDRVVVQGNYELTDGMHVREVGQ